MHPLHKPVNYDRTGDLDPRVEMLIERIGSSAHNLYQTRQFLCTEAVVVALNEALGGGLTREQAVAMAAPFCVALGESGCMCGALSGAVITCGLFLNYNKPYHHRRQMRESAHQMHALFKAQNGATCCSVLTRNVREDKSAHFKQCGAITARAAKTAARIILTRRPELADRANQSFLTVRNSMISGAFKRLLRRLSR